jgi:hypothetical protein
MLKKIIQIIFRIVIFIRALVTLPCLYFERVYLRWRLTLAGEDWRETSRKFKAEYEAEKQKLRMDGVLKK